MHRLVLCVLLFSQCYALPFPSALTDSDAQDWLSLTSNTLERLTSVSTDADWDYATDISDDHAQQSIDRSSDLTTFISSAVVNASKFDLSSLSPSIRRQFEMLLRTSGDPKDSSKRSRVKTLVSKMEGAYSEGRAGQRTLEGAFC
jgi:hypothetical protein